MKKTKKIFAVMMTLALMLVFIPTTALAVTEEPDPSTGSVRVTLINDTLTGPLAPWTGSLIDTTVEINGESTLGSVIATACQNAEPEIAINMDPYVSEINGLGHVSGEGYEMSGWTILLNNWFVSTDLSTPVEDGDWISAEYSVDFGADLGGLYGDNTKSLKSMDIDSGVLSPAFSSDTHEYTLTLPRDSDGVVVSPLATNRYFMVKTFVGETEYKLFDVVPVTEGTEIIVICGSIDPIWPSMNNGAWGSGAEDVAAETYTITIAYEEAVDDGEVVDNGGIDENGEPEVTAEMDDSPKTGDDNMLLPLAMLTSLASVGAALIVRRRTE